MTDSHSGDASPYSFQVNDSELGALLVDLLRLDPDPRSPLRRVFETYNPGSAQKISGDLKAVAKDRDAARTAEIICRPEFIMTNYTGGGSLPRSFFAVCHAPTIDGDAFAVVSPSYQGSFLFQLFETRWLFIAWWMSLNASSVADPTPNYMPPPMRYESLIYCFHTIDLVRRSAMEDLLANDRESPVSVTAEHFGRTMKTSLQTGDIRWLLPAFLTLTPGLAQFGFDEDLVHMEALARLGFLHPVNSEEGNGDRLAFGEAAQTLGMEFHRTWLQAVGFETAVKREGTWRVTKRGFLAPTGLANHLVLVGPQSGTAGAADVNHQAMTRDVLGSRLLSLLDESALGELEDSKSTKVSEITRSQVDAPKDRPRREKTRKRKSSEPRAADRQAAATEVSEPAEDRMPPEQEDALKHFFVGYKRIILDTSAAAARQSIGDFERAMTIAPAMAEPYFGKALALTYVDDLNGALETIDLALRLGFGESGDPALKFEMDDPEDPDNMLEVEVGLGFALSLRSDILYGLQQSEEALDQIELVLNNDVAEEYAADFYALKALILLELDRIDEAKAACDEAMAFDTDGVIRLAEARGRIHLAEDNPATAIEEFSKMVDIDPEDPDYYQLRAAAFVDAGRLNEALVDYQTALERLQESDAPLSSIKEVRDRMRDL